MGNSKYTRVYSRFIGYTLEDCNCAYCLYYRGRKKPCPLQVCCCAEERRQALLMLQASRRLHSCMNIEDAAHFEMQVSHHAR